jgi:hypothetical protein
MTARRYALMRVNRSWCVMDLRAGRRHWFRNYKNNEKRARAELARLMGGR